MTFRVNIHALSGLPPFFERRVSDFIAADEYLRGNTTLQPGGFIDPIAPRHAQTIVAISQFLTEAADYADVDQGRVRDALRSYQTSDARAAARADAKLPDWAAPPLPSLDPGASDLTAEVFDDTTNPEALLVIPADQQSAFPYRPSWTDFLSPTSLVRDAIWELTKLAAEVGLLDRPYDPLALLVDPFIGDMAGLMRCAEVFTHIADLLDAEARAVTTANRVIPLVWSGHASDACQVNLQSYVIGLSTGSADLRAIAATYRLVVSGLRAVAATAEKLLTMLIDIAGDEGLISIGIGLIYAVPNVLFDLAGLVKQAGDLILVRNQILERGFGSVSLAHPFGVMSPVTMPALDAEFVSIPELLPTHPVHAIPAHA